MTRPLFPRIQNSGERRAVVLFLLFHCGHPVRSTGENSLPKRLSLLYMTPVSIASTNEPFAKSICNE